MVLKLQKNNAFLQFFAEVSKKSKAVTVIYVGAPESSRLCLSENGIGYCAMT